MLTDLGHDPEEVMAGAGRACRQPLTTGRRASSRAGVDYNDFLATTARIETWDEWLGAGARPPRRTWSSPGRRRSRATAGAPARPGRGRRCAFTSRASSGCWTPRAGPPADRAVEALPRARAARPGRRAHRGAARRRGRGREPAPAARARAAAARGPDPGARLDEGGVLPPGGRLPRRAAWRRPRSTARARARRLRAADPPDYEAAVAALLDSLDGRAGGPRPGGRASGCALGGYYAPRAAAFEPRSRPSRA